MGRIFAVVFAATVMALPARAQQLPPLQDDQPLHFALQDMLNSFGYACQHMGDVNACNTVNYVKGAADFLDYTDQYCQQGNRPGCNYYGRAWWDLNATYTSYSQAYYGTQMPDRYGQVPQINPLGDTHLDRMASISAWGAANTEIVNQRAATNDASFKAFISTINN